MLYSSVYIAILILISLNYLIECGSKRQTVCLKELNAFSVSKTTDNASSNTPRPNICSTVFGCCNKSIEDEMKTHITKKVMNLTHRRNEEKRQKLKDVYDGLEGICKDVLQLTAESAIESLQSHFKGKIAQDATSHIRGLFKELQTSVTNKDLGVDNSTTTFFRNFYPVVHHHVVAKKKLPDDFAKCLKENMHVIMPFEDVPHKVTDLLTRKLKPVQVFLRNLQTVGHVLDALDNVELSEMCSSALVKMSYCSLCDGLREAKPCLKYCTDVISSCLRPYSNVEDKWSLFLSKLIKFRSILAESLDASVLFAKLQVLVEDSMSHASHSRVAAKVAKRCGNITDYKGNDIVSRRPPKQTGTRDVANGDLYIDDQNFKFQTLPTASEISDRLMFIRENLSLIRDHLKIFHFSICLNDGLSAPNTDNDNCWVGDGLGRYDKGAIQNATALHPINSDTITEDVLLLLRKSFEEIRKVTFPWQEQDGSGLPSDSGSASGSGSGVEPTDISQHSGTDCGDDDDEDNCASPSGDVDVSADQPVNNDDENPTERILETENPPSGASYHTSQTSLVGLLLLCLILSR